MPIPAAQIIAMRLECRDRWLAWECDVRLPDGSYRRIVLDEAAGDELVDRVLEHMPPLPLKAKVKP